MTASERKLLDLPEPLNSLYSAKAFLSLSLALEKDGIRQLSTSDLKKIAKKLLKMSIAKSEIESSNET